MNTGQSKLVIDNSLDRIAKRQSLLANALQEIGEKCENKIEGQFGRVAFVTMENVKINSKDLDFEFTCSGDDDTEANECEIKIYNLSNDTAKQFKKDKKIVVMAGYRDDYGVVFSGVIVSVKDKFDECDRTTTIKALDDLSRSDKKIESISYSAGTKASYILKNLCNKLGLPIAVFSIKKDVTYPESVTVDGDLMAAIKEYATACGVSAYINRGQLYIRSLQDGDDINFYVHMSTGLLGSPEEFEEEQTTESYTNSANVSGITLSNYGRITRNYKYKSSSYALGYHTGVDIVLSNKNIKSFTNGTVSRTGWGGAYGNICVIQSDDGKYCWYCHMANPASVSVGQKVVANQTKIGVMGSSGNSTGAHLHFEVRTSRDSQKTNVDPVQYLKNYGGSSTRSSTTSTEKTHGVKFTMLLQHRMTTAAKIKLESRNIWGHYRVRKWTHTFNESEATTEVEAVDA